MLFFYKKNEHHSVAESAVVGYGHDLTGEAIYAYVILRESNQLKNEDIVKQLKEMVKKNISGYAVPSHILVHFKFLDFQKKYFYKIIFFSIEYKRLLKICPRRVRAR